MTPDKLRESVHVLRLSHVNGYGLGGSKIIPTLACPSKMPIDGENLRC